MNILFFKHIKTMFDADVNEILHFKRGYYDET